MSERSGFKAWHNLLCGWCDNKASGDALHEGKTWAASCGKHGDDFKTFAALEGAEP